MKECFKISLYNLLSKDKRISRFKEFHETEVKTILLFLMQVGYLKDKMTRNFKRMLYLNEEICIKKTMECEETEKMDANLETMNKQIKEYESLKNILLKYIEKVDSTDNKEIVISFESLVLYEESIQKLYEEGAKDEEKILEILKELRK